MGCARQMAFTGPLLCGPSRHAAQPRLVLLILLALGLRALVPVGFMPATDGTFSVTICTDGFPPALLPEQKSTHDGMGMPMPQPHHQQGHGDADGDSFCAFTTGFSSAPPPLLVVALGLLIVCLGVVFTRVVAPAGIRLVHIPQARAPPACT
jgi:hypothetical protein